jgi:hypothetical protein
MRSVPAEVRCCARFGEPVEAEVATHHVLPAKVGRGPPQGVYGVAGTAEADQFVPESGTGRITLFRQSLVRHPKLLADPTANLR